MELTFTEEQKLIINTTKNFFKREYPREVMREMVKSENGFSANLWQQMVELGWIGMDFPEEYGGMEMGLLNLVFVSENMGKAGFISPFFINYVACQILIQAGSEKQKRDIVPKVLNGEMFLTLAYVESTPKFDPYYISTKVTEYSDGYILNGTKQFVEFANVADYAICIGRTEGEDYSEDGISLFLLDLKTDGVEKITLNTVAKDKQHEVSMNNVVVPIDNLIGKKNQGSKYMNSVLDKARIIKFAELLGKLEQALEIAIEYANQRIQSGKLIGSFQAVQHNFAEIATEIDGAKYLIYKVAASENGKGGIPRKDLLILSLWIEKIYLPICWKVHEIFGAISFTEEFDLHYFTKYSKAHQAVLGDEHYYYEALKKELF
jgi:alkylation response protein AidB-like acyl-CoA dehydrogenase